MSALCGWRVVGGLLLRPYPESSRANSYPWSPFPPRRARPGPSPYMMSVYADQGSGIEMNNVCRIFAVPKRHDQCETITSFTATVVKRCQKLPKVTKNHQKWLENCQKTQKRQKNIPPTKKIGSRSDFESLVMILRIGVSRS